MDIVILILLLILAIGFVVVALYNRMPFWTIFAAAICIIISIVAFTTAVQTHVIHDKNIISLDANHTIETYSYQTISYSTSDPFMIFVAWGSLAMFFLMIANMIINWNRI